MTDRALRRGFALWLASALVLLAVLALRAPHWRFESDLTAMLPANERSPALEAAAHAVSDRFARQLVWLVAAPDLATAKPAAAALAEALRASPAIARVQFETDGAALAPDAALRAARFGLLTAEDAARLDAGDADALAGEALAALYSPAAMARLTPVLEDPFGFTDRFLRQGLMGAGHAQPESGVLVLRGTTDVTVLVFAETRESPFATSANAALETLLAAARGAAEAKGAQVLLSGVAPHALAASDQARREVSVLGGGSALLCAALLFAVFGALRPALLALLSMAFGMLAGLVVTQAIFGRLHLMTVVFGTSLVGVSLDYAIHFLSDQLRDPKGWQPREARDHIGTAVRMGLATTLIGYLAFAVAPMPVLRQMAVFSAVGLCASAWTVWLALPVLARRAPMPWHARWLALAESLHARRLPVWAWLVLAAVVLAGILRLTVSDEVKNLQQLRPALLAQERAVREALGNATDSRFFIVLGADAETRLRREEALAARLAPLVGQGALAGVRHVAQGVPSLAAQAANHARLVTLYAPGGTAERLLAQLGFGATQIAAERAALADSTPLRPETALGSARMAALAPLWLPDASVVMLSGVQDLDAVAAAAQGLEGVAFRDPIAEATRALRAQRIAAQERLGWVYAAMFLLLFWRYGLAGALATLAVPVAATALTLAVLAFAGLAVNLFTIIMLLLVLGFGVDYAIFLREGARDRDSAPPSSRMAVWLAAATALLSFGGLSFSATPFLRDIGLTLTLGIALAFVFSLLLAPRPVPSP